MEKPLKKNTGFLFFLPFLVAFLGMIVFILLLSRKKEVQEEVKKVDAISNDLNRRQEKILEILTLKQEITVEELMKKIKGVSERTLRRDMKKLGNLGFSKKEGNTKGSKYVYTK